MNVLDVGNVIDWSREAHIGKYMEVEDGECFIDVGAHIGLWTLYVGRKGSKVYAFEPNPDIVQILKSNSREYSNIVVCNFALGEIKEVKELFIHTRSVLNGLRVKTNEYIGRNVEVQVYRLDDLQVYIREQVGLIKIDTEGYEANVLKGGIETILRDKPRLIIEVHHGLRTLREELQLLTEFLSDYGYKWKAEYKRDNGQPILIADSV